MSRPLPEQPLWRDQLADGSARVEIWGHPEGWECRILGAGRPSYSYVFADVRDAHLVATRWLTSLSGSRRAGGQAT